LHNTLAATEGALKKAKDDVSLLKREITDLDFGPKGTIKEKA